MCAQAAESSQPNGIRPPDTPLDASDLPIQPSASSHVLVMYLVELFVGKELSEEDGCESVAGRTVTYDPH